MTILKDSRPSQPSVLESELQVLGFVCETYKEKLIDERERPVGVRKTAMRVVEIVRKYMKGATETVGYQCSQVMISLERSCLGEMVGEEVVRIVFQPLRGK